MFIINAVKNLIASRNIKRQFKLFTAQWQHLNQHNGTIPINIFPIHRVKVGFYSYGELQLLAYNENNTKDTLDIGSYVSISTNVKFFLDEQHQTETFSTFPLKSIFFGVQSECDGLSKGSIIIEDEVWIGNSVMILSGVKIGKGAIIAAGSVVVNDIPPYSVAGGVPAKVIKYRFEQTIIDRLLPLKLIEISKTDIIDNIGLFYTKIDSQSLSKIEELFTKIRANIA